jgi:hypothetical protein
VSPLMVAAALTGGRRLERPSQRLEWPSVVAQGDVFVVRVFRSATRAPRNFGCPASVSTHWRFVPLPCFLTAMALNQGHFVR